MEPLQQNPPGRRKLAEEGSRALGGGGEGCRSKKQAREPRKGKLDDPGVGCRTSIGKSRSLNCEVSEFLSIGDRHFHGSGAVTGTPDGFVSVVDGQQEL